MANFDWNTSETQPAAQQEKMATGIHYGTVVKVIHGGKQGTFTSRDGDPKILVVFENDNKDEAASMITLSEKAGWVLANMMKVMQPAFDLVSMTADGITPESFANEEFSNAQLVGRKMRMQVEQTSGANGTIYTNIKPMEWEAPSADTAVAEEEIPF